MYGTCDQLNTKQEVAWLRRWVSGGAERSHNRADDQLWKPLASLSKYVTSFTQYAVDCDKIHSGGAARGGRWRGCKQST